MELSNKIRDQIIRAQRNEITEFHVYKNLAKTAYRKKNHDILVKIAEDEKRHYEFWKKFTEREVKPSRIKIFLYTWAAKIFGLTFGVRLMERGEDLAQEAYKKLREIDPEVKKIIEDEEKHEDELIDMINAKGLQYAGSVVLGLNDALVELTGALAGLTLALQDTNLIATVGLITGIAASMSMAASEYLSTKEEDGENPLKSSIFTGLAYIFAVAVLITPYFILINPFVALGTTLSLAILIILCFTFYSSIAKNQPFIKRFLEMALISLSIAAINFAIGYLVKKYVADV